MWDVKQPAQLRQVMSDIAELRLSSTRLVLVRVGRGGGMGLLSVSQKPSNKIFELISRLENQNKNAAHPQLHCI